MTKYLICLGLFFFATDIATANDSIPAWSMSIIPSSVRIDPSSNRVFDKRYHNGHADVAAAGTLLQKNWVYDGKKALLKAARGEYVSFQVVITKHSAAPLKGINVAMEPFRNREQELELEAPPELFLEWAVNVTTTSTGYPQATLGKGWYPDALIPFRYIQQGATPVKRGWIYPLQLPDFNNRIDDQQSMMVWVDQYVPFEAQKAVSGKYTSTVTVTIDNVTKSIPVELDVWNFAIPNENQFKASLQHEGFVSHMNEKDELEIYQLMKRNRVCIMDPTYKPVLQKSGNGFNIDWKAFDARLDKYLTGKAFTKAYGYDFGPGYGTPVETFLLPFDVYGKHDTRGWPDIGKPDEERKAANRAEYITVIRKVREHLQPLIDPATTDVTVYLNGLDESYFPEAWDRMAYYGAMFKKEYPEARFRVDGSYNDSAMQVIAHAISAWAVHTIDFDRNNLDRYNKMGISQWLYGPMIYESEINSWVGSSTFTDLPLVNDRAISWSVWKYKARSWISWGMGAGWKAGWYDPETWKSANDGGNAQGYDQKKLNGNALLMYSGGIIPNVTGPCPSVRLKTMRNGVQEYEYMRLLATLDGNDKRVSQVINGIIDQPFGRNAIGKLDVWSYDPEKWDNARIRLGELISKHHQ